jgi:putative CocE/NonD family hydrolase
MGSAALSHAQKRSTTDYVPSDGQTLLSAQYDWKGNQRYKGYEMHSYYLRMRDSVPIAVDVYLPNGAQGEKYPTILHQTRYWRSIELKWPYKWFKKNPIGPLGDFMRPIISCGYAVVVIDSRGSGASGGVQPHPWSNKEVEDMTEIVDHIIAQPWSNGTVGAAGASYSGTTSEFLLTRRHPAVKAVVNMYSLFDVYLDNAFPNGMHNQWFTREWGLANDALDANTLPAHAAKARRFIRGVLPVKAGLDGCSGRKVLNDMIVLHRANKNVHEGALTLTFRDERPANGAAETADQFSPHMRWRDEDASGAAVYSWSGWYDGHYQNAAVKRHLTLTGSNNRLILGPWEHGGRWNCGHTNPGPSGHDHIGEVLRFFDYHLKGMPTGIEKDEPVHYFTMVQERWKSSPTWPPSATRQRQLYLAADRTAVWDNARHTYEHLTERLRVCGDSMNLLNGMGMKKLLLYAQGGGTINAESQQMLNSYRRLETERGEVLAELKRLAPAHRDLRDLNDVFDTYRADTAASTGVSTRFESVAGRLKTPYLYTDRNSRDSLLITYDTAPLDSDMVITGHVQVQLYVGSSTSDAQIIVYLEDVAPDGKVHYITEGNMRALHRKTANETPYRQMEPKHSFLTADGLLMQKGEVAELTFAMLPTSYMVRSGHRLRLAISGADAEHYRNMTSDTPTYRIYRSFAHPSRISIPTEN